MDKHREWETQFNRSLGPKQILRLVGAFILWIFAGGFLSIVFKTLIFPVIFFFSGIIFLFAGPHWKPVYPLFRKIAGNENLPMEPQPGSLLDTQNQSRILRRYLFITWGWLMLIFLIFTLLVLLVRIF